MHLAPHRQEAGMVVQRVVPEGATAKDRVSKFAFKQIADGETCGIHVHVGMVGCVGVVISAISWPRKGVNFGRLRAVQRHCAESGREC